MMEHRLESIGERMLIGKSLVMSFVNNKTAELWKSFMPIRREIANANSTTLYSLQIYPPLYFSPFSPEVQFEKWAAVEVTSFENVPAGLKTLTIPAGKYVVFNYIGAQNNCDRAFNYILNEWLPGSGHVLDDRPHFELLGHKYKNNDPLSEEEIWVPIS